MHQSAARYEGRPLAKPEEEVVDQGLGFDLDTMLTRGLARRQVFRGLGLGAVALGLAACGGGSRSSGSVSSTAASPTASSGTTTAALGEIPDETAGPYPGDGSNGVDVLSQDGVVRKDITASFGGPSGRAEGVPMTLELVVRDLANGGTPFAGAAVYVWHCDRSGDYSLYSEGARSENYLRGVQVAGDDGTVTFTSIFPACYPGRWPHVHFEVYPDLAGTTDSSNALATSQVALPKDTCDAVYRTEGYEQSVGNLSQVSLSSDGVFGDDGGRSQLPTTRGDVDRGYTVTLVVGVDTRTAPTGGQLGGGAPPGAPGGPPR